MLKHTEKDVSSAEIMCRCIFCDNFIPVCKIMYIYMYPPYSLKQSPKYVIYINGLGPMFKG